MYDGNTEAEDTGNYYPQTGNNNSINRYYI